MRYVGTVSRGIRLPVVTKGDDIVKIITDNIIKAASSERDKFEIRDRDVIGVTESLVARSQGNYVTLRDIDGNLIESSDGSEFALSGLIPGFAEAVLNMNVGGEVIAYLPPSLGYGENGAGAIEPNSLLVFDIELTGIVED